jgi:sensor histidine kinase YesM
MPFVKRADCYYHAFMRSPYLLFIGQHLSRLFSLSRLKFTLSVSILLSVFFTLTSSASFLTLIQLIGGTTLAAVLVFGVVERWPTHLPKWLARWVLQLIGVALIIPISLYFIFVISTGAGEPDFWMVKERLRSFRVLLIFGLLLAPWCALTALVRQKEAFAQHQALAFNLERSELERQALDARYRLLLAQIEPHFLFNTLANVRALVKAGSAQAPQVLDSLIAYLRAAVPRLNDPMPTMAQEIQLTRAYLDLMHMRMPDRLQYSFQVDGNGIDDAMVYCPAMCLLSLVENAVRHGIDPSEEGGRIDIVVTLLNSVCTIMVTDTGVGIHHPKDSLGTGLANLRERLLLSFGSQASLQVSAMTPQGVSAKIVFPIRTEMT